MTDSKPESMAPKLKLLKVEDLGVRQLPNPKTLPESNPSYLEEVLAVLTAIAAILASKFLLLLSVLGGFVLAFVAVQSADILKIVVCAVYDAGVILPVAYLYWRGT